MGRGAGVWLAAVACAVAVVLASLVGPVTFGEGGLLDRIRPLDADQEQAAETAAVDDVPTSPVEARDPLVGVPAEVLVSVVVVIVASALLARALLRARRDEEPEEEPEPDVEVDGAGTVDVPAVLAAARRGLLRLDEVDGGDPGEVVVACWVELELAGHDAGSGRAATDTPTDFARRLTAAVPGIDEAALHELRRTYSRVRFGRRAATADDVATARACLTDLLAVLEPTR